ncbi:hypothetical protein [Prevotella sp. MGM2]|uniref:hypothetical protein n=1 Tax=Prevotella sp. MGM2 TaxID=2033406 RepID=UPI000CE9E15C|nr:hypothetical protein [Prevotella sp. MGM2]GAY30563.1 T-complex family protein [Prevotella sp. MGM2]
MKIRHLFYLLASLSMVMSACETDNEISGNDTPPEDAIPSAEFHPNNLAAGTYTEDAIRIVSEDEYNDPFSSIELTPDGYYLFTSYNMYNSYTPSSNIAPQTGENTLKANSHKGIRTRSTMDENGTISFNYSQYGKFTKIGDKQYRLSNGIEIDLRDAAGSNRQVRYKHHDGTVTVVYVSVITGQAEIPGHLLKFES